MRILFLSGWFPYPPDNGIRIRIYNLVRCLSKEHEVTLVSFADDVVPNNGLTQMRSYCRSVHTVPYKEFDPTRWRSFLGFLSPQPRSLFDTHNPQMATIVQDLAEGGSYDIVIACELRTAPYALLARRTCRMFDDVELTVLQEQFSGQNGFLQRVRYGLTWLKTAHFVSSLLPRFDACTVVSERERDLVLRVAPGYRNIAVVPNGVDAALYTGDFGTPKPDTLIHTGALSYVANWDAMSFFLSSIFPLIKMRRPEVELRITGGTNRVALDSLPRCDGVAFTGYLDDIRPAVAQSWVSVVPLRIGGGTRLKILEAMALGTPVVSTSKGAEGLDVTPEENILIADEPEQFAKAVLRLLDDASLRARLGANGRELVSSRYRWEQIGGKLERVLQQVIQERQTR